MITVQETEFFEVKLIQLKAFEDERGFFSELYRRSFYLNKGIDATFVQTNLSYSKRGVIRGMHFQSAPGQAKLVMVVEGSIYDVFVDIRPHSATFGKWGAHQLDAGKHQQLFIPKGFAHGFAALSESAHVLYQVDSFFNTETEKTFRYDDPAIGIRWPFDTPILSEKDRHAPLFEEVMR